MNSGGVNLTTVLSIYLYRIYIYHIFFTPLLMNWQKKEEKFRVYICIWLYVFAFMCFYIHDLFISRASIGYLIVFVFMHELRGSFYWALLNSCMYNSMSFVIIKKGRLLAQKPITLVLKLINSCSYSINDLVVLVFMHELRERFYWALLNSCIYNSMSFVIIKKGDCWPKSLSL